MVFIGREEELAYLNERYHSSHAEFIVLYGRRRIGKTELLKNFVQGKLNIFYTAVQVTDTIQLRRFSGIVSDFYQDRVYREPFSSWENLFRYIGDQAVMNERLTVVLDEFPYMVEENGSIPSILQQLWDHHLKNRNIMLLISGSSMAFMERDILSEKNPLYGRATGIYKLQEMDFESARGFMPNASLQQSIQYYSIFSGVPYYLSLIDPAQSIRDNIQNKILKNGAVLFNEAEFLLKQELRDVHHYNGILESVAMGNTKLNDIYQKTEIDKHKLPYYINNLIDLNILEREFPATLKPKERAKSRAGLYRLQNSYFRFYYAFVYPNMTELMLGDADIIFEELITPNLDAFVSVEYEKICIQRLRRLNRTRDLPFRFTSIGRWWDRAQEIDIVAYNPQGAYLICECKWRNQRTGMRDLLKLQEKTMTLQANETYFMFFSKSGFTSELLEYASKHDHITLVSEDEPQG